jgi:hypothetical protein
MEIRNKRNAAIAWLILVVILWIVYAIVPEEALLIISIISTVLPLLFGLYQVSQESDR